MAEHFNVQSSSDKHYKTSPNKRTSDHLAKLAEPKKNITALEEAASKKGVKPSAMKYRATKRILSLSKPKRVTVKKIDQNPIDPLTQSITSVSPSALMYKPTKRILELAQPK
ncbi:hypothetical protein YQE_07114, partial [Dendroctonus ponderosae]